MADVYALSGYWSDIQEAVNTCVGLGGGTVHIPSGLHDFHRTGEAWTSVEVPLTVPMSIVGAPTVRDQNGQVISWGTTLNMPYPASGTPTWFDVGVLPEPAVYTQMNPGKFCFSDIKMIGWRHYDVNSKASSIGMYIQNPIDFRVDHCNFDDLCWNAMLIGEHQGSGGGQYVTVSASGVIDHNRLTNTYGYPGFGNYDARTLDYGIGARRWAYQGWDTNLNNIWGKYTNYSIYIEDNYFTKWRHGVCMLDGLHYVFRRNTVESGYGLSEVDGHGSYADDSHPKAVGIRCVEVYDNTFKNPDPLWMNQEYSGRTWALNIRGGSWIVTNNKFIGYWGILDFNDDWGNYAPYRPDCKVKNTYIWNNDLGGAQLVHYNADSVLNTDYFLRAPNVQQDGLAHTPYTYPHPLTLGDMPTHLLTVNSNINGIPFNIRKVA